MFNRMNLSVFKVFKSNDCWFCYYCFTIVWVCILGAVDENGKMPFYAEECASMLAVTFSSGGRQLRNIVSL